MDHLDHPTHAHVWFRFPNGRTTRVSGRTIAEIVHSVGDVLSRCERAQLDVRVYAGSVLHHRGEHSEITATTFEDLLRKDLVGLSEN